MKSKSKTKVAQAPSKSHRARVAGKIPTKAGLVGDDCSDCTCGCACDDCTCGCACDDCSCGCSARQWGKQLMAIEQRLGAVESLIETRFGDITKILKDISSDVSKRG